MHSSLHSRRLSARSREHDSIVGEHESAESRMRKRGLANIVMGEEVGPVASFKDSE